MTSVPPLPPIGPPFGALIRLVVVVALAFGVRAVAGQNAATIALVVAWAIVIAWELALLSRCRRLMLELDARLARLNQERAEFETRAAKLDAQMTQVDRIVDALEALPIDAIRDELQRRARARS